MELLEQLARLARCEYISDLHYVSPSYLHDLLIGIRADDYPLKQWLDAEEYLCCPPTKQYMRPRDGGSEAVRNVTGEDIRQRILVKLRGRKPRRVRW
jgi:hypothetical protein